MEQNKISSVCVCVAYPKGLLTSNKKMTMYEKWMNRGTLLKRDPVAERKEGNKSLPAFLTEQQQYNIFQNRAKERDEK